MSWLENVEMLGVVNIRQDRPWPGSEFLLRDSNA